MKNNSQLPMEVTKMPTPNMRVGARHPSSHPPQTQLPPGFEATTAFPGSKSLRATAAPSAPPTDGRPYKRIHSQFDLEKFYKSQAFLYYTHFLNELNDAVKSKSVSQVGSEAEVSKIVKKSIETLEKLKGWIQEFPLIEQRSLFRYGNIAFRGWFEKVSSESEGLMREILKEGMKEADIQEWQVKELATYFTESFGNSTRIDYGTGHEAAFCAWMCCLARLNLVGKKDSASLVTRLFTKYLDLMRTIQIFYKLEPAGSHGVWGLDDHQFLPYIWGSAQLIDHPTIKPKDIHNKSLVEEHANEYLYFGAIKFIYDVKKGPFAEHSPLLNDISGVPLWSKVNSGLIKMYYDDVLRKHVVIQHFVFGKLLPFEAVPESKPHTTISATTTTAAISTTSNSEAEATEKHQ